VFIPIGTDRPLARPTVVNHALVAINIAVFFAGALLHRAAPEQWAPIQEGLSLDPQHFRWWTLISYAFVHGGLWHILGNMVFLWVFGANVEDRLGRAGYLAFYLLGAAISGGMHAVFDENPVIGASGAVAAVTGSYLVLFPRTQIKTLVLFFYIGIFEIPAWWFIAGQIALNLFMEASATSGNVATLAHLGGYGFGVAIAALLLATGILKREVYDLFTISRQAARRRQFREITYQRERAQRAGKNPDQALKPKAADEQTIARIATARAEISDRLENGDLQAAAGAYRSLLQEYRTVPGAVLLARRTQYDIANALVAAGDHPTAATAYELFLEGYPTDSETPVVRLMLGLISARYLNDPVRARSEINTALPHLADAHRELAQELLTELG
jgi:membrane associated rhomboid family serine protease